MKIAYIYDVIYPETIGGVEKRIHEIGIRLSRQGHEVHLYGMKYWDGPDVIVRNGIVIHGVCQVMNLYTGGRRSILQAVRYTAGLALPLLHTDADIIDCQNFPYFPAVISYLISRLTKRVLVVTWHEFWGYYWFSYLGVRGIIGLLIERLALWCSPRAIAVSPLTAGQMLQAGYYRDIPVIPNGIDLSAIDGVAPASTISDIIFVARFIPEKHPELVVQAVRCLVSSGMDIKCIMVGDGPEFSPVQELIRRYDLSERITCTGFLADHNEVVSLMKSSKVFILPSEREGFGIAAIEALACGLQLVTARHPRNAASAHVLPGGGYLAEMDAGDIATGIKMCLLTGPDESVIKAYVNRHDWDQIASSLEKYYESLYS
jgi:glycosyltransferase involved in cell wall biosynthesis